MASGSEIAMAVLPMGITPNTRQMPAIHWTLGGFALLVLGYFGSKFMLEILLGRV